MRKTSPHPPAPHPRLDPTACSAGTHPAGAEEQWQRFLAYLRERGARVTRARQAIFRRVLDREDHFRADDLTADLATGPDRVSRGTIYRTLALMVETGFVRLVRDSDTHWHYEHAWGHSHHDHMVCDRCGSFIEFTAPEITRAIERHCARGGFRQRVHRVSIFGVCRHCAAKEKRRRR